MAPLVLPNLKIRVNVPAILRRTVYGTALAGFLLGFSLYEDFSPALPICPAAYAGAKAIVWVKYRIW